MIVDGDGPRVGEEDLPSGSGAWPGWVRGIWVALAEGRGMRDAAGSAVLWDGREPASGRDEMPLPMDARAVWRVVRGRRWGSVFRGLLDERWRPLAEPAMGLLERYLEEAEADGASDRAKERGLAAAKEILRVSEPRGGAVQVNVGVGQGGVAVLGLEGLLAGRDPLRPAPLLPGGGLVAAPGGPAEG